MFPPPPPKKKKQVTYLRCLIVLYVVWPLVEVMF